VEICPPDPETFKLILNFDGGGEWHADFRITGRDRIRNIDANYDAIRVQRQTVVADR